MFGQTRARLKRVAELRKRRPSCGLIGEPMMKQQRGSYEPSVSAQGRWVDGDRVDDRDRDDGDVAIDPVGA